MIKNIEVIHIGWEQYEYTEDEISNLNEEYHYGVYQIYGYHPVYGDNTLLYIGKANHQKFSDRLKDRTEFYETVLRPKTLCIGMIYKTDDCNNNNWEEIIDVSEKILIKAHAPAYNSQGIKGLIWKDDDPINQKNYIIKNWGDYGKLLPEVSSLNVTYSYWNDFNEKALFLGSQ